MPSIIDGLFAGRAGIQSNGTAISVLADNIANQNTIGFKQSRPDFVDLLAGSLSGAGAVSTGSGSSIISTTPILNQGTFEFTGRGLDIGIDGNGYFVVSDPGAGGSRFFTRAGNFQVDTDGNVLDQNGLQVLGFPAGAAGGLEPLNVNVRAQDSVESDTITIAGNLDAESDVQTVIADYPAAGTATAGAGVQLSAFSANANFSTFVDVFDSLGGKHTVTTYFYNNGPGGGTNNWDVRTVVDGSDIAGGTAGEAIEIGNVTLQFGSNGTQASPLDDIINANNIQWNNGSGAGNVAINFSPFTQFASASNIQSISQDGTGSGSVIGFNVEPDGTLFAQLDNGQTASIGTVSLAIFANAEGLSRVGNSLFAQTSRSGEPVIGTPNTGTFGSLESGALELSTADIAGDFIKLISLQRGFQGSARIITNIDDLLNEIINLA